MADSLKSARNVDNGRATRFVFKPSKPYGYRILRTFIRNGREYQFHATKGWRVYRVTA